LYSWNSPLKNPETSFRLNEAKANAKVMYRFLPPTRQRFSLSYGEGKRGGNSGSEKDLRNDYALE